MEVVTLVELLCRNVESPIKSFEELLDSKGLVAFGLHGFDCELDKVDSREGKVASSDRGLRPETVAIDTGAASHSSNFVDIAFWIVRFPCIILVEGSVEIEEVREETPCTHLAGILIEVIVSVLGEIADASFFLPN